MSLHRGPAAINRGIVSLYFANKPTKKVRLLKQFVGGFKNLEFAATVDLVGNFLLFRGEGVDVPFVQIGAFLEETVRVCHPLVYFHRLALAVPLGYQPSRFDTLADQIVHHGLGSQAGKVVVVFL